MNAKSGFGLSKSNRLKSKIYIQKLFASDSRFKKFPITVQYFWTKEIEGHLFMPIVSKRKFKRATDRNRVKRQLREAWRLNQHIIQSSDLGFLVIGIAYIANEKLKYSEIENALKSTLLLINEPF